MPYSYVRIKTIKHHIENQNETSILKTAKLHLSYIIVKHVGYIRFMLHKCVLKFKL